MVVHIDKRDIVQKAQIRYKSATNTEVWRAAVKIRKERTLLTTMITNPLVLDCCHTSTQPLVTCFLPLFCVF